MLKSGIKCHRFMCSMGPSIRNMSTSTRGQVYSMGEGFLGSLGHGDFESRPEPTSIEYFANSPVQSISTGWAHSAVTLKDGNVMVFGRLYGFRNMLRANNINRFFPPFQALINKYAGHLSVDAISPIKAQLPEGEVAVEASCSAALTAIRTESGKVFCLGDNRYGQCGTGVESVYIANPEAVEGLEDVKVTAIASGFQHVIVAAEDGGCYAWGKGENGQLGSGTTNHKTAKQIEFPQGTKIVRVGAGFNHSVALTDDGKLYAFGKMLAKKLKPGEQVPESATKDQIYPRLLKTQGKVVDFATSQFHTMFKTDDHRLWVIGRQKNGTKFVDDRVVPVAAKMHETPTQIDPDNDICPTKAIHKLCRGMDNTGIITHDGKVLTWDFEQGFSRVPSACSFSAANVEFGFKHSLWMSN